MRTRRPVRNLELDGEFGALERATQGTPEKQYGDTIIPAVEPEWKDVAAQAEALLERTRDLRVLTHLAVAKLHVSGLEAFVQVLTMIRQQLETRWEHVHPQLDPEDDNDPTLRANALLQLADTLRVLRVLRVMPLAVSKRDGPVSWRILGVSTNAIESTDENEHKADAVIRAAFNDTGHEKITALAEVVATGMREATGISDAFDTHSGYGHAPDLSPLTKLLHEIARYLTIYAPSPTFVPGEEAEADVADGTAASTTGGEPGFAAPAARTGAVTAASLTAITNRADAIRLLDLVCRYYEQYEPSSPLPLMIARARKLADKGFLEILQDLAPDAIGQAQSVVQSREP